MYLFEILRISLYVLLKQISKVPFILKKIWSVSTRLSEHLIRTEQMELAKHSSQGAQPQRAGG